MYIAGTPLLISKATKKKSRGRGTEFYLFTTVIVYVKGQTADALVRFFIGFFCYFFVLFPLLPRRLRYTRRSVNYRNF